MKKDSLENILFKELCNPVSRSFRCNLLDKTLQHCTRTALCEGRSTIGNHVLLCLRPTYRCCQLSHQVLLDFYRVSMRHSVYILIYGALRSMDFCCIDGCFQFNVGDTVRVDVRIKEGDRERIQAFEGTVIAKKHGGVAETFTVRRVAYGVGIERVFPINSPFVEKVTVVRKGKVRRAKLFYLRGRTGKAAKVKSDI